MKTWHKVVIALVVLVAAYFAWKWATRPGGITATAPDKSQTGSVVQFDPGSPTNASNLTQTADTSNVTPQAQPIVISDDAAGTVPI